MDTAAFSSPLHWSVCGPAGRSHSPGPQRTVCLPDLSPLAPPPTAPSRQQTYSHWFKALQDTSILSGEMAVWHFRLNLRLSYRLISVGSQTCFTLKLIDPHSVTLRIKIAAAPPPYMWMSGRLSGVVSQTFYRVQTVTDDKTTWI